MSNLLKRSEKLQEKLNHNFDVTSKKTTQQLKDVKKKVKDLKHQIAKVSSNFTDSADISSANLNSQFYVQKDRFDANRRSVDETRLNDRDVAVSNTIAATIANGKDAFSDPDNTTQGGKTNENILKEDKFKRVRENVPVLECLIAKTISWNNTKLKGLDEEETKLEEEIDAISEDCKQLLEAFNKERNNHTSKDTSIIGPASSFRKHSFVQKYLERRKIAKGNEYATTIKNEEEEAGYDNKNGKYATIKEGSKNKHATNQEIDQEDIGVPKDDDDNLQITSKLNLTEKFEATSPSSAWVGSTIEPMIEKSCEEIKKDDINLRTTLRTNLTQSADSSNDKLDQSGSNGFATTNKRDYNDQNIEYDSSNHNSTNLPNEMPPNPKVNYGKEEMGLPLNEKENKVAKVRSTDRGMSQSGQQHSAKNQTCDRGVWSWQDERIFLQVLYSIMNSYNNSMNIYQGGMINIKSNDGNEDVCSNNDGGLMQNNEFDVCRVKSVERCASFPKHQKQMYDTNTQVPEDQEEIKESINESHENERIAEDNNAITNGFNFEGGKEEITSSNGGIKHGGQNSMSKHHIDGKQLNLVWWYKSEKIKAKFLHNVWSKTSGQVNSMEEVEKHMNKWIKKQKDLAKTREKIEKWKLTKKRNNLHVHFSNESSEEKNINANVGNRKIKRDNDNDMIRIRNKEKIEEWKEMKHIKKELQKTNTVLKKISSSRKEKEKIKLSYSIPKINPMPRSLSDTINKKPNTKSKKNRHETIDLKFLHLLHHEASEDLIKSFQERDQQMIADKMNKINKLTHVVKDRKSFEDIHPIRPDIKRFNSTQFYTSSMIDLSSYNNPTQSSQAKVTTSFALNNSQNDKRPGTASKTYPETKKNVLMQIEHVPRLRIPAWRSIS